MVGADFRRNHNPSNSGEEMAKSFDFKKLRRLVVVQGVVQFFLLALLLFMAVKFQGALQAAGRPQGFLHSVITTLVIQLALFYPLNRFATRDAEREVASAASDLTTEEMNGLRQKRLFSEYLKAAIFIFYATFAFLVPQKFTTVQKLSVLSVIMISFILTFLTYFQCFNFAARRLMKEKQ
jgi:hypothetical protein